MGRGFEPKGFYLNEKKHDYNDIGSLSLKISLECYLSTYKDIGGNDLSLYINQKEEKFLIGKYLEHSSEAIFHFQHFIELYIKKILREIHPILSMDSSKKHTLMYKLLFNEPVTDLEVESIKQLEFSEALNRFLELFKVDNIKGKYQFIVDAKDWIREVNNLRNRISHRGVFILNYESLDHLFGNYILPFLKNIFNIDSSYNEDYYFKKTYNGISPIDEIIDIFKNGKYDVKNVSVLKEMGRASYNNNIYDHSLFQYHNDELTKRAETLADYYAKMYNDKKEICPVCGVNSFVLFEDTVHEEDNDGNVLSACIFIYNAKCYNCDFDIDNRLYDADLSCIDLNNIFKSKEL